MQEQIPTRFLFGVSVAVVLYLVRPGWLEDGGLGDLLFLAAILTAVWSACSLLMVGVDRLVAVERRTVPQLPLLSLVLGTIGTATLVWLVTLTQGRQDALMIVLSAVLAAPVIVAVARWNHAHSASSSATDRAASM